MKLTFTFFCFFVTISFSSAQVVADFENYKIPKGSYINDASPEPGFESGSVFLPNEYTAEFDFWSGFAISADTNTTTPGFTNQYSAIAGEGALQSNNYAVCYIYGSELIYPVGKALGKPMIGLYVTNSTYAYLSMRDGDSFAKKFGGETGDDPDFFLLTIRKYFGGVVSDDSINVYLADYRSPDPSKDYIVDDWKYVDLSDLGEVDSLALYLRSSDNGIFGMNTPAYVCFDNISTDNLLAAWEQNDDSKTITFGPNPASDVIYLNAPTRGHCSFVDVNGRQVWAQDVEEGQSQVNVSQFPAGIYFIRFEGKSAGKFTVR